MAFDVIEHLPYPHQFLQEAHRVLRRDGVMVISTPNTKSIGAKLKGSGWFAYRDETHVSIQSLEQWREGFAHVPFEIQREGTDTLWDPPYVKWIPTILQKGACLGTQWLLTWVFGPLPWRFGENYIAVLRKP